LDTEMRRQVSFECDGSALAATLDEGTASVGLLIISGGNEIRIGAHGGMAKLAQDISAKGFPVFRFDRRGIGDSEGENAGFTGSAEDLTAATLGFRTACADIKDIVAFGNCDAAAALMLHLPADVASTVLANPWVIEPIDELPPAAAIKARYIEKLKDPRALLRLISGGVNIAKLIRGLRRAAQPAQAAALADKVAAGMTAFHGPIHIILAAGDATALAFADAWQGVSFAPARERPNITVQTIDSASHSFASDSDYDALKHAVLNALQTQRGR
jgi:exosortase A-associated hydrolase 1